MPFPIIPNAKFEIFRVIAKFHFDLVRLRVAKDVAQCLGRNSVNFISQDRMQVPWGPFHKHMELGGDGWPPQKRVLPRLSRMARARSFFSIVEHATPGLRPCPSAIAFERPIES